MCQSCMLFIVNYFSYYLFIIFSEFSSSTNAITIDSSFFNAIIIWGKYILGSILTMIFLMTCRYETKTNPTNYYFFFSVFLFLSVFLLVFVIIVSLNRSSYISYSPLEMTNIWQSPLKSDQQRSVALLIHSLNVSMTLYDWAARQSSNIVYIYIYVC